MQWCREGRYARYIILAAALGALFALTSYVNFDYGFFGIVSPLFAAFPGDRRDESAGITPPPPKHSTKLILFTIGIMLTYIGNGLGNIQLFALLTIPLLAMYSGKPGKRKLKYFFYVFYPVHLLLIELAAMLIY